MKEPRQQTLHEDEATLVVSGEETTLVSPRFDDEETLVARPVVPLEADAPLPTHERTTAPHAPDYSRPHAPRRNGMLALVLASVLIGGVLGGAGLYVYQRQAQPEPAATTTQPAPSNDAAQETALPANVEGQNTTTPSETPSPQTEAPATAATNVEEAAPPAPVAEAPSVREPENVPAAERRTAPAESAAPKRGKKGARDEETERRAQPSPNANVARNDQPEARRVDSIFYRQRRAARRARRDDSPDRLRRIFEGTPE
jgi:cytoskeletal protein RodZ